MDRRYKIKTAHLSSLSPPCGARKKQRARVFLLLALPGKGKGWGEGIF